MSKKPENIQVIELEIKSGGPRENLPALVCPYGNDHETAYRPVDFNHRRYTKGGLLFHASVYANVCTGSDCGAVFFLPEVGDEISLKLEKAIVERGLRPPRASVRQS